MKNTLKVTALVLLAAFGMISRCHASTVYTNGQLKGCYSFLSTSRDAAPLDEVVVGTICFDGRGNIVPDSGAEDQTGWEEILGGSLSTVGKEPGTYSVTNSPGQGMGTFSLSAASFCGKYAFSLHSLDAATRIAGGFQFALITPGACGPAVVGGWALLQPWAIVLEFAGLRFVLACSSQGPAMMAYKKIEITIETAQVVIIRKRHSRRAWCEQCGCEAEMVSLQDAATIKGATELMLSGSANEQKWHFSEAAQGKLVCLKSLLKAM
jgi:hypothetical protein